MSKLIIHNVTDLPDEVCLEMVLRVVKKGRTSELVPYKHNTTFNDIYHVTSKKTCKKDSMTDVFWITKDIKDE